MPVVTAQPGRRAILTAAGAAVLAGCLPWDEPEPPTVPREVRLRRRVAADVDGLVRRYEAVLHQHPDERDRLVPLVEEHRAHARALRALRRTPSPAPSPQASGAPSPPVPAPPASRQAALAWLARAEAVAATRRAAQVHGVSAGLARLLASISACEAAHAALLREGP